MMLGPGKMLGDDEALRGCKHLTTVICQSQEAKLFSMKKEVNYSLINVFKGSIKDKST